MQHPKAVLMQSDPSIIPERMPQLKQKHVTTQGLQFSSPQGEITVGQVWSLRAHDTEEPLLPALAPRLVVVQEVGCESAGARAIRLVPISADTRYPGIFDLLVPGTESPIGCSFMIECWNVQAADAKCLDRAIGKLQDSAIADIRILCAAFRDGVDSVRTVGITGRAFPGIPLDRRLQFQAREAAAVGNAINLLRLSFHSPSAPLKR